MEVHIYDDKVFTSRTIFVGMFGILSHIVNVTRSYNNSGEVSAWTFVWHANVKIKKWGEELKAMHAWLSDGRTPVLFSRLNMSVEAKQELWTSKSRTLYSIKLINDIHNYKFIIIFIVITNVTLLPSLQLRLFLQEIQLFLSLPPLMKELNLSDIKSYFFLWSFSLCKLFHRFNE